MGSFGRGQHRLGGEDDIMNSRRLRIAVGAAICVGVLIAAASLASSTLPPVLLVLGSIPPAVITGFLVYLTLPLFSSHR